MKKYLAIGISVMMTMAATGQAKIPADFWSFPMKGINPVLAELYAATQGQSLAPFSVDPNPDILFNKMDFKSITQMDGTTIKTVKGKTSLMGNTVNVELLTYNGASLVLKSTIYILCDMQSKSNTLVRLKIVPSEGNTLDLSVSSYDLYNDSQAASDLAQFFTVWGKFFNVWYADDSVTKNLRK